MHEEKDSKRIIGLYGEMNLSMELHQRGWQVYNAYIDEQIDFIIARYYCTKCKEFSDLYVRRKEYNGTKRKTITNLCTKCKEEKLKIVERFLQVKTSEGILGSDNSFRNYSFHANLKYHVDDRTFYVWIAVIENEKKVKVPFYYIFYISELNKFDNIELPSYQITDNQKLTFRIDNDGVVLNQGQGTKKDKYQCFNDDFFCNFEKFNEIRKSDNY